MRPWATAFAVVVLLAGCSVLPKVKLPGVGSVSAFKDAGTPATIAEGTERTGFRVPANSRVRLTKTDSLPKEGVLLPAKTEWEFELPEPTDFVAQARRIQASTGTVDMTMAAKRIDAQERRWLLFAAIGCGVAGIVARSMLPAWPAISNGLFLAAVLAGVSWKLAELPAWIWVAALGVSALLVLGYKRGEWDKDGDGIPDVLQRGKSAIRNPQSAIEP